MNEILCYIGDEIVYYTEDEMLYYTGEKLTKDEKARLRRELDRYRYCNRSSKISTCLEGIPFVHSPVLFGITRYPCAVFGKQLVLKIVDELLDDGEEGREDA